MNELEAKCYLTKQGGANNSDHDCIYNIYIYKIRVQIHLFLRTEQYYMHTWKTFRNFILYCRERNFERFF